MGESMDYSGGLLKFFMGGADDVVQKCMHVPELRKHVADAAFLRSLRNMATKAESATSPELVTAATRELMSDPRLMQCAMLGAGVRLTVAEEDMQRAERVGEIEKRSPLKTDDIVEAMRRFDNVDDAKSQGTAAYKRGETARAVAYWCRALAIRRLNGLADDPELASTMYSNIAQALLKLDHPKRAEQAATRALAYLDVPRDAFAPLTTRDLDEKRRKALYRRALSRERLKQYADALQDARIVDDAILIARLQKFLKHEASLREAKQKRVQEERDVQGRRASGLSLSDDVYTSNDALGYLGERDYSNIFLSRIQKSVKDVQVDLGHGAFVQLVKCLSDQSSVSLSVTTKRGKRALYYDIDLVCSWEAHPPQASFDISPSSSPDDENEEQRQPVTGTMRLYNVSQETKYQPGADQNVAYMYQLGYRGIPPAWFDGTKATNQAPDWARILIDGAHELYEAFALHLNTQLDDFRVRL